jgi:hypothetical protein
MGRSCEVVGRQLEGNMVLQNENWVLCRIFLKRRDGAKNGEETVKGVKPSSGNNFG